MKNKKIEYLIICLALVILTCAFFSKPIINNEKLIPADILFQIDNIWKIDNFKPHNPLLSDITAQFYPWQKLITNSIANHQLPLWNPYSLGGEPFLANQQTAIFDIAKIIAYILHLSAENYFLFAAIFSSILAGFFCYLYLRNLKIEIFASLAGAIVFALCGPMLVWKQHPLSSVFLWLPLILFCIDKIILEKKYLYSILFSICIAAQFFAGNVQMSLIIFIILICYLVFRLSSVKKIIKEKKAIITIFLAAIIGLLIASIQLVPAWNFIKQSSAYSTGRSHSGAATFQEELKNTWAEIRISPKTTLKRPFVYFLPAIYPKIYGNPVTGKVRFPENNIYNNFNELSIYASLLLFIFALISLSKFKENNQIKFFSILGILSFLIFARVVPFNFVKYLPILDKINLERFRFVFFFCIIVLGALGLNYFLKRFNNNKKIYYIISSISIFIILIDIFYNYFNFQTSVKMDKIYPKNNVITFLEKNLEYERVSAIKTNGGLTTPLSLNTAVSFNFFDIRGYNAIKIDRYAKFANEFLAPQSSCLFQTTLDNQKYYNLMAVKYILCDSNCSIDFPKKNFQLKLDDSIKIYENTKRLPRTFIAYNTIKALNSDDALDKFKKLSDPNIIILEGDVKESNGNGKITTAKIVKYSPNRIEIEADAANDGYLFLSDVFYQNWKAQIDGTKTEIFPANVAFRAIKIPKGPHQIIFQYSF